MTAELDLSYHRRFPDAYVPEAYEKLIHDCLRGQHANFVRDDELRESWSTWHTNQRWVALCSADRLVFDSIVGPFADWI